MVSRDHHLPMVNSKERNRQCLGVSEDQLTHGYACNTQASIWQTTIQITPFATNEILAEHTMPEANMQLTCNNCMLYAPVQGSKTSRTVQAQ